MELRDSNMPLWMVTNAWREIFARIFESLETEFNVSPEWLINPSTHRRLKLDMSYPEIGVAVRFEGLQGKQRRRRPSLEEEAQERTRREARIAVCQEHDIHLIVVDLVEGKSQANFQRIDEALSRVGQNAKSEDLLQSIKEARVIASKLAHKITTERDLKLYTELWNDRQYQISEPGPTASQAASSTISYTAGMEVEHTIFGPGVVTSTTPHDGDILITVDFITAGQKTLAASLVSDKLLPR